MSDYLQATSYLHAGKDWPFDTYNHLKDIKITLKAPDRTASENGTEESEDKPHQPYHFVYSLPKKCLLSNASTFSEWQEKEEGSQYSQARKITFLWFLDFIQSLSTSKGKKDEGQEPAGQGVSVFMETVLGDNGCVVGDRIHVFVNRQTASSVSSMLSVIFRANNKRNRDVKKFEKWEYHQRHVKNIDQYITNVCNVYRGNTRATADLNDMKAIYEKYSPEKVFSFENFGIDGACEMQKSMLNYKQGDKYVFPRSELVIRRHWHELNGEYLWKKYLPSYQYTWVDLPQIHLIPTNDAMHCDMYIKRCPAFCLVQNFVEEYNRKKANVGENTLQWHDNRLKMVPEDVYKDIINITKGRFTVYEVLKDAEVINQSMGPKECCIIQAKLTYSSELKIKSGYESVEFSERLKAKYQNQHSISSFDIIEMETAYHMEFAKSKRKIKEDMVSKFEQMCVSGDADISKTGKCIANWLTHVRPEEANKFGPFEFEIHDPTMSPFANIQMWFSQCLDTYMCVASAHSELIKLHYAVYDAYRQHGINQLHWNMIYTGEGATSKSFVFEQMHLMSIPGTVSEITYQTTRADAIDGDQNDHITVFNEAPPGLFHNSANSEEALKALSSMKEKLTSNRVRTKEFYRDEETGERKNRVAISSQIGVYVGATNDNPADAEEAVKTRFHWGEFEKVFRKDKSISDYQRKAFDMESKPALKKRQQQFLYYCHDQQCKVFYIWKFIFCGIIRDVDLDAADIVLSLASKELKLQQRVRIPPRTVERYRILCRILTITNALDMVFNLKGGKHQGKDFELKQLLDVEPLMYCTEEIAVCALNMVSVEIPELSLSRTKTLRACWKLFCQDPKYKSEKSSLGVENVDYNYFRLKGSNKQILKRIQNSIPYSEGKPSIHNINSVLQTLSSQDFHSTEYVESGEVDFTRTDLMLDGYPERMGMPKSQVALIFGNNFYDIHFGLFDEIRTNKCKPIMKEVVLNTCHSKTKNRRIITGVPDRNHKGVVEFPQFLQVLDMESNDKEAPLIRNSNQEGKGVKSLMDLDEETLGSHTHMNMNMDADQYGWYRRCVFHLNIEDAVSYHPEVIDFKVSENTIRYPEQLTNGEQTEKRVVSVSDLIPEEMKELIRAKKRRKV